MDDRDAAELEWWRSSFTCRFGPNNLPHPRDALLGIRFHLYYDDPDNGLLRYEARAPARPSKPTTSSGTGTTPSPREPPKPYSQRAAELTRTDPTTKQLGARLLDATARDDPQPKAPLDL